MSLPDLKFRLSANDREARNALSRARTEVRGLGSDSRRAAAGARQLATATNETGRVSRRFGFQVQNAAFQVGDFAVQVGGGTSAIRAMSQQLPQLLGGFGVFGAVAGAAFAILAPLTAKLFEASEATAAFADEMNSANSSLGSIRSSISTVAGLQENLNAAIRASGGASSASSSTIVANSKAEFEARKQVLAIEVELLNIRRGELRQQLTNLQDQQRIASDAARERLRNLGPGATGDNGSGGFAGGGPSYDDIANTVDLGALSGNRRVIDRTTAELSLLEIAAQEAKSALDGVFTAPGVAEAAGGATSGGGGGQVQKTPVETAIGNQITAMQSLVAATRGSLSEASGAWGNYFQDLATSSGTSSQKILGIAKSFGAAQALIDAYRAHNAVLADPYMPWWMRIAAAGKVLASGIGAVNAIKSVTAGGGAAAAGGATSSAASTAVPATPLQATLNLQGPLSDVLSGSLSTLLDGLNEEAGDRGYQLLVRPS